MLAGDGGPREVLDTESNAEEEEEEEEDEEDEGDEEDECEGEEVGDDADESSEDVAVADRPTSFTLNGQTWSFDNPVSLVLAAARQLGMAIGRDARLLWIADEALLDEHEEEDVAAMGNTVPACPLSDEIAAHYAELFAQRSRSMGAARLQPLPTGAGALDHVAAARSQKLSKVRTRAERRRRRLALREARLSGITEISEMTDHSEVADRGAWLSELSDADTPPSPHLAPRSPLNPAAAVWPSNVSPLHLWHARGAAALPRIDSAPVALDQLVGGLDSLADQLGLGRDQLLGGLDPFDQLGGGLDQLASGLGQLCEGREQVGSGTDQLDEAEDQLAQRGGTATAQAQRGDLGFVADMPSADPAALPIAPTTVAASPPPPAVSPPALAALRAPPPSTPAPCPSALPSEFPPVAVPRHVPCGAHSYAPGGASRAQALAAGKAASGIGGGAIRLWSQGSSANPDGLTTPAPGSAGESGSDLDRQRPDLDRQRPDLDGRLPGLDGRVLDLKGQGSCGGDPEEEPSTDRSNAPQPCLAASAALLYPVPEPSPPHNAGCAPARDGAISSGDDAEIDGRDCAGVCFAVGDRVEVDFDTDGWFGGCVASAAGRVYSVHLDSGEMAHEVEGSEIRAEGPRRHGRRGARAGARGEAAVGEDGGGGGSEAGGPEASGSSSASLGRANTRSDMLSAFGSGLDLAGLAPEPPDETDETEDRRRRAPSLDYRVTSSGVEWLVSEPAPKPSWSPPTTALLQALDGGARNRRAAQPQFATLGDYFRAVDEV